MEQDTIYMGWCRQVHTPFTVISDDPLTVLRKYELLRGERITFGCFLLFCRAPSIISTIEAGRFDSETIIKDSVTVKDDLFSEVEMCVEFIQKHISKRYVITGKPQRDEIWEYPLAAIREIVINMIVHRDYQATSDSTIKIHSDRIEFFNPGALPDGVSIDNILSGETPSRPRNRLVAAIFKEAGIIEKYGSGIKRVHEVLANAGAPVPVFQSSAGFFKVTLFPAVAESNGGQEVPSDGGVNGGANGGVNGGVNELLVSIKQYPGKKAGELSQMLNIPRRSLERRLKGLKQQGVIEFRGAPKTGGYYPTANGAKRNAEPGTRN